MGMHLRLTTPWARRTTLLVCFVSFASGCPDDPGCGERAVELAVRHIATQAERYRALRRRPPAHLQELVDAGYLAANQTTDPWGHPISYFTTARWFVVCSAGPDSDFGTQDDVCQEARVDVTPR